MSDWLAPCSPMCVANCYVLIDPGGEVRPVRNMVGEEDYREIAANRSDVILRTIRSSL